MTVENLTRRSVVAGCAVAGAAAVAGFAAAIKAPDVTGPTGANAAGYGADPGAPPGAGGAPGKQLAAVADVPTGGGLVLPDDKVVLVSGSDATIHAFSSICTHQGCPVSEVSGGRITCPCHGSVFDAASGDVLEGPATSPLPKVAVVVSDGTVRLGGA